MEPIIIIQHHANISTDGLLNNFAANKITTIKLRPDGPGELPTEKLISKSSGIVLVDTPDRRNTRLYEEEIKLVKEFRHKKKILALGSGSIIAGLAHGATINTKPLHLGWFPIAPKSLMIKKAIQLPRKVLVNSNTKIMPPEKAKVLLASRGEQVAYLYHNLVALDFITTIDANSYDLLIRDAENNKTPPSSRIQTSEELIYYREKYLKNYRHQVSNIIQLWINNI